MCVGGRVKKRPLVPRNHAPVPAWLARVQCLFYLPLPPDRQTDRETHGLSRGRPKVVVWRANTQPPRPPTPQRRPHTHPSGRKPMPQTNPHTTHPTRIPPTLPPPPPPPPPLPPASVYAICGKATSSQKLPPGGDTCRRKDGGPGREPEIPSKHPPRTSALVRGVGQRRRAP